MKNFPSKLAGMLLVTTAALAGCGGSSGSATVEPTPTPTPTPAPDIGQSVTALIDFVSRLITDSGENTEPIAITTLTLATDDTAEPATVK
jgi:hypothetical protein